MRASYWSHSSFARWVVNTFGGVKQLDCGTSEEWVAWRKASKQHRFVHWFTQDFLTDLQDFVYWPSDRLNGIRCYMRNRFVDETHKLRTGLKPGRYYDLDTKLLHGMFEELADFIEIEKAGMYICWNDDAYNKYNLPWWHRSLKILRWSSWRCPEAGMDHLNWEMQLTFDDEWIDKNDPIYGKLTPQAISAREQFVLYHWWKYVRPQRRDPYDVSGWAAYCIAGRKDTDSDDIMSWFSGRSDEDYTESKRLHEILANLERQYEDEDTAMLIKLVEIRKSLWT